MVGYRGIGRSLYAASLRPWTMTPISQMLAEKNPNQ